MARIKVCPSCGIHNAANVMQCENCGRDIGAVKPKDEALILQQEQAQKSQEEQTLSESETDAGVADAGQNVHSQENAAGMEESIICEDCGYHNETNQRKCNKCGASLVGIPITRTGLEDTAGAGNRVQNLDDGKVTSLNPQTGNQVILVSLDGQAVLEIAAGETIIGRQHSWSEYLTGTQKNYVGRRHARITNLSDGVYIEDLNSTNGTFINGVRLEAGSARALCESDVIGLGGNEQSQQAAAFFRIQK